MFLISIYVGCLRNINVRLNYIDGVVNFKVLNVLLDGNLLQILCQMFKIMFYFWCNDKYRLGKNKSLPYIRVSFNYTI